MPGDAVGAGIDDATDVTVGKGNVQQVVKVPDDRHSDTGELWRAVQRIESKLDLSLSEQGRLVQQDASMMQQISMLTQQVSQISAQSVQFVSQLSHITAANAERDRINSERDRRVMTLEQQAQQKTPSTTSFDRLLVMVLAMVMLGMFAANLWGMR